MSQVQYSLSLSTANPRAPPTCGSRPCYPNQGPPPEQRRGKRDSKSKDPRLFAGHAACALVCFTLRSLYLELRVQLWRSATVIKLNVNMNNHCSHPPSLCLTPIVLPSTARTWRMYAIPARTNGLSSALRPFTAAHLTPRWEAQKQICISRSWPPALMWPMVWRCHLPLLLLVWVCGCAPDLKMEATATVTAIRL